MNFIITLLSLFTAVEHIYDKVKSVAKLVPLDFVIAHRAYTPYTWQTVFPVSLRPHRLSGIHHPLPLRRALDTV